MLSGFDYCKIMGQEGLHFQCHFLETWGGGGVAKCSPASLATKSSILEIITGLETKGVAASSLESS